MSLEALAQNLASHGRMGDSMLVHMAPEEVGGLEALARAYGGELSVNPDTGLLEANFLRSILPAVLGGALTVASGGALSPFYSAMLIGGGTALATRNLEQGLMAGMGAYGGASLGGGLANLGGASLAGQAIAAPGTGAIATGPGSQAAMLAAQNAGFGLEGLGRLAGAAGGTASGASAMGAGLQQAMQTPQSFIDTMGGGRAAARAGMMAGAPALAESMTPQEGVPQSPQTVTQHPRIAPASFEYDPNVRDRFRRYARGGIAALADNPYYTMSGESGDALAYLMGQRATSPQVDAALAMPPAPTRVTGARYEGLPQYTFDRTTGTFTPAQAPEDKPTDAATREQELARLYPPQQSNVDYDSPGGFYAAGGRLLQGSGDGVSDSIPAKIDGQRPARLATGEFVLDARTVSEIGNGDTRAGAKKLYAMMDAIHRERATAKRGAPSNADAHMQRTLA